MNPTRRQKPPSISRGASASNSSVGEGNTRSAASPTYAVPSSTSSEATETISECASDPSASTAGHTRWWSIGWAFTNPALSASPVMVNSASSNRREPAATLAPNRPPGASFGPARPMSAGRVRWIWPSFLGYPWNSPRANEKS